MDEISTTEIAGAPATGTVYPWNRAIWERHARQWPHLAHALLLQGEVGLGKNAFALSLAQLLLCAKPTDTACNDCRSCLLFGAQTHPDFHIVSRIDDSKQIGVDQIRALGELLTLRPHTAARRVVILTPADAMNANAANALLKMLEEPPADNYLLLVAAHPQSLPATIRSRCGRVDFAPPRPADALAWLGSTSGVERAEADAALDAAGGAPLQALALLKEGWHQRAERFQRDAVATFKQTADPLQIAAQWKKIGACAALDWFQGDIAQCIRARQGGAKIVAKRNNGLQGEADRLDLKQLYRFLDLISRNRSLTGDVLDEQLLLEEVLIAWSRLGQT